MEPNDQTLRSFGRESGLVTGRGSIQQEEEVSILNPGVISSNSTLPHRDQVLKTVCTVGLERFLVGIPRAGGASVWILDVLTKNR